MSDEQAIERVPSGVSGLDIILGGGFPKGGIHVLQGPPGAGKTTLANQICYQHAASGGRALLRHPFVPRPMPGCSCTSARWASSTRSRLPEQVAYISGFGVLEAEGLRGCDAAPARDRGTTGDGA